MDLPWAHPGGPSSLVHLVLSTGAQSGGVQVPGAQGTQGEGALPCSGLLGSPLGWTAEAGRLAGKEGRSLGKRVRRNDYLLSTYCVLGAHVCYLQTQNNPTGEARLFFVRFTHENAGSGLRLHDGQASGPRPSVRPSVFCVSKVPVKPVASWSNLPLGSCLMN